MENLESMTTIQVEEDDGRKDAMGDLPDWDSLTYQEIITLGYYWKKDTDGRWIPRPCEWKDGSHQLDYNKLNNGDDSMTVALRRMAANQKSLIKCGLTDEVINNIKPEMDLDEAISFSLKAKREAFVQDCENRRAELKTLKKEANLLMSEFRSPITMKELCTRLQEYSVSVRNSKDTSYDFRVKCANKAVTRAQELTGVKEKKPFNDFINRYYWAIVTRKLVDDPVQEAEARVRPTPALVACMTRYLEALQSYNSAETNENQRQEPNL